MRPSKDRTFLDIASSLAERGTCIRKQVGCVITDIHGYITSTGYNGVARGLPHCNEKVFIPNPKLIQPNGSWRDPEHWERTEVPIYPNKCAGAGHDSGQGLEICEAIHAEQNALLQCADVQKIHTVYVTVSPCRHCMKLIMNTSAKRVVFLSTYSQDAKDLADKAGISWELFSD
jgi:dCMP deaminase